MPKVCRPPCPTCNAETEFPIYCDSCNRIVCANCVSVDGLVCNDCRVKIEQREKADA